MAETCCAEENEINYQIDCLGGFVQEKVRENRIRRMLIKIDNCNDQEDIDIIVIKSTTAIVIFLIKIDNCNDQ